MDRYLELGARNGNRKRPAFWVRAIACTLAATAFSGCAGQPGERPEVIRNCKNSENHNIEAVVGSPRKEDDPKFILDYADENNYIDETGDRGFFASGDHINGLGELVCKQLTSDGSTRKLRLRFLSQGERIRDDYLAKPETVLNMLGETERETPGPRTPTTSE